MITHCEQSILQIKCPWFPNIKIGSLPCTECPYFKGRKPNLGYAKNRQAIKVNCLMEEQEINRGARDERD